LGRSATKIKRFTSKGPWPVLMKINLFGMGKHKGKFTLKQTMKAQRGSRGITILFL
jgi:hypothetical protein